MGNHIVSANLNILNGVLSGTMEFSPGLNIISGENGTLKTQLLQSLRGSAVVSSQPGQPLRMQAISPKRNSERRTQEAIMQFFRQNNRTWETNLNERVNAQINMHGFDSYASVGELYFLVFEHRSKDGADRLAHMTTVSNEFNEVIQAVFPQYRLSPSWDESLGSPRIKMSKNGNVEFPIESLSMGEQEVLSLILTISTSRESVDVYLIDEPEVHLNWHLEERLFTFVDDFCEKYGKQAIVVTHSRTIFKPRFLSKAQFLSWGEDQRVTWSGELTKAQRTRLAGDAVEIVAMGDFSKVTFFVEDDAHAIVIKAVANLFNVEVNVSVCGNVGNVKSLFKHQRSQGAWLNAVFMIDGDNQGNPFPNEKCFLHLPYYCVENLILDPELLGIVSSRSVGDVRSTLLDVINDKRNEIFKKNKFFEFLADSLTVEHITFDRLRTFDASVLTEELIRKLGLGSFQEMLPKYLAAAKSTGRLDELLPKQFTDLMLSSAIGAAAPVHLEQAG